MLFALVASAGAAAPSAEKYLHSGELAQGELALRQALQAEPANHQQRFGLGLIQFLQGVERLGQGLYEYGHKPDGSNELFLHLPVPANPNPSPVTFTAFRRVLDRFHRDLLKAEATFALVQDDTVKLPLKLAHVKLDLDGDGKATDQFMDILRKLLRRSPDFLKANPEFLICFDRGDAAWFRGYCHLLAGFVDLLHALDLEDSFDKYTVNSFAKSQRRRTTPLPADVDRTLKVLEPARLVDFREHMVMVARLNRECWMHVRVETDDDHEWLPNEKQKSMIGLPLTKDRVDAWLDMMAGLEKLFEGKSVLPQSLLRFVWPEIKGHLSIRKLLDDPPADFDWDRIMKNGPDAKYLQPNGDPFDFSLIMQVVSLFNDPMLMLYMAWLN
jgi:hypothetical protein